MKLTISLFLVFLYFFWINGQAQTIHIGENKPLGNDTDRISSEGILAINPHDSLHLLSAFLSAKIQDQGYDYHTKVMVSFEGGGGEWKKSPVKTLAEAADPWCIITSEGKAVVADISEGSSFHLKTQFSPDGGKRWEAPLSFGNGHDHGMLIEDRSGGKMDGGVYLVSTQTHADTNELNRAGIMVARSMDGGHSFPVIRKHYPLPNHDINAKTPIVLSNGNLIIPFISRGVFEKGKKEPIPSETMKSYVIISTDGGETFSEPYLITEQNGRRHHILVANQTSPFEDELYYLFVGLHRKGLFYTRSTDMGKTWSNPLRLDLNRDSTWVDLSAAVVSTQGVLGIMWSEKQNGNCYDKYFSASIDGGKSFTPPIKINDAPSCPDESNGWVGRAWPQGGDYHGLVSKPNGDLLAIWSDARSGRFQMYSAEIKILEK